MSKVPFSRLHKPIAQGIAGPMSVFTSLAIILGVVGLFVLGIVGALIGVGLAWLLSRYGGQLLGTTTVAPELVACGVCGEETVSPSGLCPRHR